MAVFFAPGWFYRLLCLRAFSRYMYGVKPGAFSGNDYTQRHGVCQISRFDFFRRGGNMTFLQETVFFRVSDVCCCFFSSPFSHHTYMYGLSIQLSSTFMKGILDNTYTAIDPHTSTKINFHLPRNLSTVNSSHAQGSFPRRSRRSVASCPAPANGTQNPTPTPSRFYLPEGRRLSALGSRRMDALRMSRLPVPNAVSSLSLVFARVHVLRY